MLSISLPQSIIHIEFKVRPALFHIKTSYSGHNKTSNHDASCLKIKPSIPASDQASTHLKMSYPLRLNDRIAITRFLIQSTLTQGLSQESQSIKP
ncbi:MAG: hypothetical protein CMF51_03615 [Legionellales bacterium]|nr:hypothetical protein [Legionellales bacterium]